MIRIDKGKEWYEYAFSLLPLAVRQLWVTSYDCAAGCELAVLVFESSFIHSAVAEVCHIGKPTCLAAIRESAGSAGSSVGSTEVVTVRLNEKMGNRSCF